VLEISDRHARREGALTQTIKKEKKHKKQQKKSDCAKRQQK